MSLITRLPPPGVLAITRERISAEDAVSLWLAQYRSEHTRRAYGREIQRFSTFLRGLGLERFLRLDEAQAHIMADAYRASLVQSGLSAASINRSMASLNSFTKSARRHGLTSIRLELNPVPEAKYRDTKGPGTAGVQKLLQVARNQFSPWKAARDVALIRLNFALGLRREEIVGCDLDHLDLAGPSLSIRGKGQLDRRVLAVPPAVVDSLKAWIAQRGDQPGALFLSVDKKERLSANGYYTTLKRLGDLAGIKARPHGIRHAAVTAVLDASNGDVRRAKAFATTTLVYDDNRQDLGGSAARLIDALIE